MENNYKLFKNTIHINESIKAFMGMIKKKFRRIFNWRGEEDHGSEDVYIMDQFHQVLLLREKGNNLSKYRKVA